MKDAADYLTYLKALILVNTEIADRAIIREEVQEDIGMFRYRLTLRDGSLLELFERFQIVNAQVVVGKYRYHWQDLEGRLRKRWDCAAHHPEVPTFPHHVHDGEEATVRPHHAVTTKDILAIIGLDSHDNERNRGE